MINKELEKKIEEGEHQKQDFKYAITDSKKIARSLVAFANTVGGSLLLGVKDNGKIVGVSSDEEFFMIEAAANIYCKPPVPFKTYEWKSGGRTVLEIKVKNSKLKPHKALNKEGKPMVYVRVKDQNLLANKILIQVWKDLRQSRNHLLQLNKPERMILNYLSENRTISFRQFYKKAKISRFKAERIFVNLLCMGILVIHITEKRTYYTLSEDIDESESYHFLG